jgi:thiopurine S-methyltransferase
MEPSFWNARWKEGRIGFHEGRPNAYLTRFGNKLGEQRHVLVPLCGKTEDLAWLAARGHRVIGIELVEDAARAFFAEHRMTPHEDSLGPFKRFHADAITLLTGDFFKAEPAHVHQVDAFFDRAAIVALPEVTRERYVRHLRTLLPQGALGLTITFEYPEGYIEGPPFSVPEAELRALYRGAHVELLAEGPAQGPRFTEAGGKAMERCFFLTL